MQSNKAYASRRGKRVSASARNSSRLSKTFGDAVNALEFQLDVMEIRLSHHSQESS